MLKQIYTTNDGLLWAVGRNGMMKEIGLDAWVNHVERWDIKDGQIRTTGGGENVLHISPINTRCVGNCEIQLDKQLARQLIPILKKFSGVCDE